MKAPADVPDARRPARLRGDTQWVRKQYHFWPGEEGLDAWDVDRLVELSKDLPVKDVDLTSIDEIDSVYWFDELERPTVRKVVDHARLIEEVDLFIRSSWGSMVV